MSASIDNQFNDIIEEALRRAAHINCSAEEYRNQLRMWWEDNIKTAIAASHATDDMNEEG